DDPAVGAPAEPGALVRAGMPKGDSMSRQQGDRRPLAGAAQGHVRREVADGAIEDGHGSGVQPLRKLARLRRGLGLPPSTAISPSIVLIRRMISASEPYSTIFPS